MPIVLTKTGLIPYNRTTVTPYAEFPATSQPLDQSEQNQRIQWTLDRLGRARFANPRNRFLALGHARLRRSYWYLNTHGVSELDLQPLRRIPGKPRSEFLASFVQTPEPSSIVLLLPEIILLRRGCSRSA